MTAEQPSAMARVLTWAVVALAAALIVFGAVRYGFSLDVRERFWRDIAERLHGPMTFRFYLQPAMAFLAALPDGIRDARHGHSSFFWTAMRDPTRQAGRLRQGLISTARVMLLGISMDVIYQFRVFDEFYPGEAVMMALLLALIPYFVFRWIVERVANWWSRRNSSGAAS